MKSVTLKIGGMHCAGCASNVQSLLERQAGTRKATASFEDGEARVLYDPQAISLEQLIAVIERGGYRVDDRIDS